MNRFAVLVALLLIAVGAITLYTTNTTSAPTSATSAQSSGAIPAVTSGAKGTANSALPALSTDPSESAKERGRQLYESQQILFVENKGQIRDSDGKPRSDIAYVAQQKGVRMYLTAQGISYVFTARLPKPSAQTLQPMSIIKPHYSSEARMHPHDDDSLQVYRMDLHFVGANANPRIESYDRGDGQFHFYTDAAEIRDAKGYRRVVYREIYPHIDLAIYTTAQGFKYDFVVKPSGNPDDIAMEYRAASSVRQSAGGGLEISNPLGVLQEHRPISYQTEGDAAITSTTTGQSEQVSAAFSVSGTTVRFTVDSYDPTKVLVIDPEVQWATLYGGSDGEFYNTIEQSEGGFLTIDYEGSVIVVGNTTSSDFPTKAGFQATFTGASDAYAVKLSAQGKLLWATYMGGSREDWAHAITTNATGDIYIAGHSDHPPPTGVSFPIANPVGQGTTRYGFIADRDAFLMKLNKQGVRVWGTIFGGQYYDDAYCITLDPSGNILLGGFTQIDASRIATDGTSANSTGTYGNRDAFVAKFSSSGTQAWGTVYGGGGEDAALDIAASASHVAIVGSTTSNNLSHVPTGGKVYQQVIAAPTFVVMYPNPTSSPTPPSVIPIEWSTYVGPTGTDATSILLDDNDNVIIAGSTTANGFQTQPSTGTAAVFQTAYAGGADGFIIKLDGDRSAPSATSGNHILWSTLLGGTGNDYITDLAFDWDNSIWITGYTASTNFPLATSASAPAAIQPKNAGGNFDAFVAQISDEIISSTPTTKLLWSTYYGGCDDDRSNGIATEQGGGVAIVGYSFSPNFPTSITAGGGGSLHPYLMNNNGNEQDAFIVKFGDDQQWRTYYGGGQDDCAFGVTFDRGGNVIVTGAVSSTNNFPSTAGLHTTPRAMDLFLTKWSPYGVLRWSLYYGGNSDDQGRDVGVDGQDNILVVGTSNSTGPIIPGDFGSTTTDNNFGGYDALILEFDPDGSKLWATNFGGTGDDRGEAISVAEDGSLAITGETTPGLSPSNIPQISGRGAYPNRLGSTDAFVAKYVPGTAVRRDLEWSSYIGGGSVDVGTGVTMRTIGGVNYVAVTGKTNSTDFSVFPSAPTPPTPDPLFQRTISGGEDAFLSVFKGGYVTPPSAIPPSTTVYGAVEMITYIGGSSNDAGIDVAFGSWDDLYVTGYTTSSNFPATTNAYQPTIAINNYDAFVGRFSIFNVGHPTWLTFLGGDGADNGLSVVPDADGNIVVGGIWTGDNFPQFPDMFQQQVAGTNSVDAFAIKMNDDGFPLWGTLCGGDNNEGDDIDVAADWLGNVAIVGTTPGGFPISQSNQRFPKNPSGYLVPSQPTLGPDDPSPASPNEADGFVAVFTTTSLGSSVISTLYGGDANDQAEDIVVDADGNATIVGTTYSHTFPAQPGYQLIGATDAFIARINQSGFRQWMTLLGGGSEEDAYGVALDADNNVIVVGRTKSSGSGTPPTGQFPATVGQAIYGGGVYDAFIAKLDRCGFMLWATLNGGAGDDQAYDCAVAKSPSGVVNDIVLTGRTTSGNYPTTNPLPPPNNVLSGPSDAFIGRLSSAGAWRYNTFFGGAGDESGNGIAVGTVAGAEVVATVGSSTSAALPVGTGGAAIQAANGGGTDAFIAVIPTTPPTTPPTPPMLRWTTFHGGTSNDVAEDAAFDNSGNLYYTGGTASANFPISTATALTGGADAFVARVVPAALAWGPGWSTYFGSPVTTNEHGYGVAVDKQGNIVVGGNGDAGTATLPISPLVGTTGYQGEYGGGASDAFLAMFNGATGGVVWGTWIGGLETDEGKDVAVDQVGTSGSPYLTGATNSRNFPVSYGAFQTNRLGGDAFVVKMNPTGTAIGKRRKELVVEQLNNEPNKGIGVTGDQPNQGRERAIELDVSPNPTHGSVQLTVFLSEAMPITVELYSIAGKRLRELSPRQEYGAGKQSIILDSDGVPSGSYLVRVVTPTVTETRLLTIVR